MHTMQFLWKLEDLGEGKLGDKVITNHVIKPSIWVLIDLVMEDLWISRRRGCNRERRLVVPVTMAMWIIDFLGSSFVGLGRSEQSRKFERSVGWVKTGSNSRGRSLEVGILVREINWPFLCQRKTNLGIALGKH